MKHPPEPTIVSEIDVIIAGIAFRRRVWSDHRIWLCPIKFLKRQEALEAKKKDEARGDKLPVPPIPAAPKKKRRPTR